MPKQINDEIKRAALLQAQLKYAKTVFQTRFGWVETDAFIDDPCPMTQLAAREAKIERLKKAKHGEKYEQAMWQAEQLDKIAIKQAISRFQAQGKTQSEIRTIMKHSYDIFVDMCINVNTRPAMPTFDSITE